MKLSCVEIMSIKSMRKPLRPSSSAVPDVASIEVFVMNVGNP